MEHNELMETAQDLLENGGTLPPKVTNKLLAGMIMYSHGVAVEGKKKSNKNEKRIIRLEVLGSSGLLGGIAVALKQLGIL